MKPTNLLGKLMLAGCLSVSVLSCEQVQIPEMNTHLGEPLQVDIETRTTEGITVAYPVRVFAFRMQDGVLAGTQTLAHAGESLSIELPAGEYNLVVFSGSEGYTFPESPENIGQTVVLDSGYTQRNALMYGCSYVNLQEKDVQVSVQMYYKVCKLSCVLNDVPEDASRVELTVYPVFTAMGLDGELAGPGKATIAAVPTDQEHVWEIPVTYLWGTDGTQTTLSVQMEGEVSGTKVVSSTLNQSFKPSVPYLLSGSYREGIGISGELEYHGWEPSVEIPFYYGEDMMSEPEAGTGIYEVEAIPEPKSVWNNHIVACVTSQTADRADLLLISRKQWKQVSSATGEDPEMAFRLANDYTEDDLSDWRIPTSEEAKQLLEAYSDPFDLAALNEVVAQAGGSIVLCADETEDGSSVRYLCHEAQSSFPFGTDGSVSTSGDKRTYRLILVHAVSVIKK